MNRLCAALLLSFALLGAGTAQAGFAPSGELIAEAEQLSATGFDSDAQGNSLIAWSYAMNADLTEVRARRISAGGNLGPVIEVAPGQSGFWPAVAVTPSGRAFIAWRELVDPGPDSVKGRWLEADGTLGPILTLAKGEADVRDAGVPQAVVGPADVVTVAWENEDGGTLELRRVNPGGILGPLVEDIGDGAVTNPVIAALPNGSTVAVWRNSGTEKNVVTAANVVGTVEKISETNTAGDSKIATDAAGNSLVVWRQIAGADYAVRGRRLDPAGAPVGPEVTISPPGPGFIGSRPAVAADSVGNFLVTWNRQDAASDAVVYARGLNSAAVFAGPEQALSISGVNSLGDLPALLDGDVGAVAWREELAAADPVLARSVNGLGVPTSGIGQLLPDGYNPGPLSSVPAAGFAAFAIEYAISGSAQGVVVRRFMVPPTCSASAATVVQGNPVTIPIACTGLALEGAQVVEPPRHGTLTGFDPLTNAFVYTPRPGYEGPDGFTYTGVNDGGASAATRVSIAVGKETVEPRIKKLRFIRKGKKFRLVFSEPATAVVRVKAVTRGNGKRRIKLIGKAEGRKSLSTKATIKVKGKLARKLAAGGRFRAIAVATDVANNRSKAKRTAFRLRG